ncbi:hypothetical protein EG68_03304 [Paragonimus skrjabini miyazakii]|uniref:Ubiquitin carboxyl-terminal hydrolase n=1 Tax=Paragonimus skrjabini miyazakii TaxID=59628 RepID=A0A8S9Z0B5_9TREM|nr:hypothetical protein EG68_03304 [Paragonimus skrjabini miyazakii]
MDQVLDNVILSDLPVVTKLTILRNCLTHLENSDCLDSCVDIAAVCLYHLHSNSITHEPCQRVLRRICDYLIIRISDESLKIMLSKMGRKFQSLNSAGFKDASMHIQAVEENERLEFLLDQLEHSTVPIVSFSISFLRILNKQQNVSIHSNHAVKLKRILPRLVSACRAHDTAISDDLKNIVTGLFHLLSHLTVTKGGSDDSFCKSTVDLTFCIAESIWQITNQSSQGSNSDYEHPCSQAANLVDYLHSLMVELLISPVSSKTCYLPLVSLLFLLDISSKDSEEGFATMCSFISSVVDAHAHNVEGCSFLLRRLTIWLMWPENGMFRSPLDKWIIGFNCEIFKHILYKADSSQLTLPKFWSNFMLEQLRLVKHIMIQQNQPSVAVLNTLAFLLLAGVPSVKDPRYPVILKEFIPVLNEFSNNRSGDIQLIRGPISTMVQLLTVCLSDQCMSTNFLSSDQSTNPFDVLHCQAIHWSNHRLSTETATSRLKVYQWSTLLRWGARAGVNLRRCWLRWESLAHETGSQKPHEPIRESRVLHHRGLVNVGNTCYANAALQLLYHCPDFRVAVLENRFPLQSHPARPSSAPFVDLPSQSQSSVLTDSSGFQREGYEISSPNLACGLLRSQLLALFRALSTQQGPPVRDPGAVLTLSKPAHFVAGEQQDAVEYLNHLLERLHEDELSAPQSNTSRPNLRLMDDGQLNCTQRVNHDERGRRRHSSGSLLPPPSGPSSPKRSADEPLSLVRRLFGGQLVRYTACAECAHVSSVRVEHFSLLYLPVTQAKTFTLVDEAEEEVGEEDVNQTTHKTFDVKSSTHTPNMELDLTSLIRAHFTQTEYVSTQQQCESCGKVTKRARRLSLRSLASHVLICLNVFTYCRTEQTGHKLLQRISIPERLSVKFSESVVPTDVTSSLADDLPSAASMVASRSYMLQGMILHHGMSISCGHYTCVTRVGMQWISFDDDTAHYTTLEQVYEKPLTTPYLLLYTQV